MKNYTAIVLCDDRPTGNLPGVWKACEVCALEVFLCNTTVKTWVEQGITETKIYCIPCGRAYGRDQNISVMELSEIQIKELQKKEGMSREQILYGHAQVKREIGG